MVIFATLFMISPGIQADTAPSLRQPHPLGWMHATPVGETPGWKSDFWINFELSWSNIWNAPHTMTDTRNGNTLEYFADYEQVSAILELGGAITKRLSFAVEIPHAYRSGGDLDSLIDNFHVMLGNRRFNRHFYPDDQYNYSVETNGVEYYEDQERLTTVANVKPKLKYWAAKWENKKCPCGLAFSVQGKIPVQDEKYAGTTGDVDIYTLMHLGIPLGRNSAMWFTGAYSYLGDNPAFDEWPRNKNYIMYELAIDANFARNWSIGLMARAESPYLDVDHLQYEDPSSSPSVVSRNRASSGWNSLVRWRGSNGLGLNYYTDKGSQIGFWIAEDWGIGPYDASDDIYSNGAPDINFVLQTSFGF